MKNYLNTYKTHITSCNLWRVLDRAILNPSKLELGSILTTPRLFYRVGYLLYVFIINGIPFFNQDRSKYQALYSSSSCFVPCDTTPFGRELNNVKPQKYILAKRFNYLTYIILNNKCK